MIIDLHTHTRPRSDDSRLEPAELIERAKQTGLDGICLTEHDCFWDEDALARLSEEHDFLVLSGVEINVEEGHLLVFGGERDSLNIEYISSLRRAEYIKSVVDEAGFIILAHPFRGQTRNDEDSHTAIDRLLANSVFQMVDAIETLNGRCTDRQNELSSALSQRLALKGIGGSDAHQRYDIPSSATLFEREIHDVRQLVAELKAGRFRAVDLRQGQ